MIPTRVLVALDTLGLLRAEEDEEYVPRLSGKERAAAEAACNVLIHYLSGEQEYKDTPARRRCSRRRRRPPSQRQGARRGK